MTEEDKREPKSGDDAEQESVRSMLRQSKLTRTPEVDLLTGVQRRIRQSARAAASTATAGAEAAPLSSTTR